MEFLPSLLLIVTCGNLWSQQSYWNDFPNQKKQEHVEVLTKIDSLELNIEFKGFAHKYENAETDLKRYIEREFLDRRIELAKQAGTWAKSIEEKRQMKSKGNINPSYTHLADVNVRVYMYDLVCEIYYVSSICPPSN